MTIKIPLTQNKFALIDAEDFGKISAHSWCYHQSGYAFRGMRIGGKNQIIRMHREITQAPQELEVDHINGDKLDNRKANLRLVTRQQNSFNTGPRKGSKSQFKGVGWFSRDRKWRARIMLNGKEIHLGLFEREIDAAEAYNSAALEFFGEFARLNKL